MQIPKLIIPKKVWQCLIKDLKVKGEGKRESGAFLLGTDNNITEYICYDTLYSKSFESGIIEFESIGYIPLWEYCKRNKLKVLADVHTHPYQWTGQSTLDKEHPMITEVGHFGLIVPQYASKRNQDLTGVGIYEYLGKYKWRTWKTESGILTIKS
ncbi:MAG: hypothetical protein PSX81_03745 [bacterium]|nr:hypothetical protein [bacterium]